MTRGISAGSFVLLVWSGNGHMLHLFDHKYLLLKCITKFASLLPALELSLSVPLVLMFQGVFRRAGARGLIYDFLLLSCGIRLLMFQPCFDRILICLIRSLIYYNKLTHLSHSSADLKVTQRSTLVIVCLSARPSWISFLPEETQVYLQLYCTSVFQSLLRYISYVGSPA